MIQDVQDFFKNVQHDVMFIRDYLKSDNRTNEQRIRVIHATIRIMSVFGMGVAVGTGVAAAFTVATPVGVILKLSFSVAMYAVNHNTFYKILDNETTMVLQQRRLNSYSSPSFY